MSSRAPAIAAEGSAEDTGHEILAQCVTNVQRYSLHDGGGVTTNPSILAKSGRAPFEVLHEIRANNLPCEVLAASFKNSQQVLELTRYGVGACTVGAPVIQGLVKNAAIDSAVDVFIADFEGLTGAGATMATCLG